MDTVAFESTMMLRIPEIDGANIYMKKKKRLCYTHTSRLWGSGEKRMEFFLEIKIAMCRQISTFRQACETFKIISSYVFRFKSFWPGLTNFGLKPKLASRKVQYPI